MWPKQLTATLFCLLKLELLETNLCHRREDKLLPTWTQGGGGVVIGNYLTVGNMVRDFSADVTGPYFNL
jgi:hypothetical protein